MICAFCGDKFNGRPVKQGGQVFCSIECADRAAEIGVEEEDFLEEYPLEMDNDSDEEEES
jgi:hypothetical protein